jgi:N-acetylmuramoyl-L-alanine amidase
LPRIYRARQGDCISSIAAREGLFWQTLWDQNSDLKAARKDPNRIAPGDKVSIPDLEIKQVAAATEQTHRFKRKGIPAKLKLVIERDHIPLKSTAFTLTIGANTMEGETDDTGLIDIPIDPTAKTARLEIADLEYELQLGGLDPEDCNEGMQARLMNLGFYDGALDGDIGEQTQAAVEAFRAFAELGPGTEVDDEMLDKLFELQDHQPLQREEEAGAEEEDEPAGDGDATEETVEASADEEEDEEDEEDADVYALMSIEQQDEEPEMPDDEEG